MSETEEATPQDVTIAEADPVTFSAEYVKELRDEAASHRIKAKRTDDANLRLAHALIEIDGRLVNPDEFAVTEDLLDDSGIIDQVKVQAAIADLVNAKPYLARRKPITPITQGVQSEIESTPSLFALVRDRV